ncbi:TonB-dependent receptor [Sphingomonas aracearum]|uniref:TonB-dependent receptor n=1 Tax=Sphingomonas aracearum TaxID=2283317 RepID=A0A369VUP3_9SPHN|nr:TonB-dependent receptor [Sphingomonas aracearum]RDE05277.1 TonB-dependent receptor [Sphingomonas aracearum]
MIATQVLLSTLLAGAQAQEVPAAAGPGAVGEVVVTAQRREQSAQDVGVALSVLSGEELARRGVTNVNDLQFQTPSLEVVPAFGGGQPQFRLRGVGFEDYATNNTPTVGIYVDEVAYPVPAMTRGALFDIERVEVLRGPQGTLYGRNTTGGAVNFISRRPTDRFSAGADLEYGSFGLFKGEAFVSGPISDTLKVRVSGIAEQGGAFQRNRVTGERLGDADRLYGRALLEWTPAAGVDLLFNVHGGRDRSEQTGLYLFRPFQTRGYGIGTPGPVIPADPEDGKQTGWGLQGLSALVGTAPGARPSRDNDSWGASLTASLDVSPAVQLTSITSYEKLKRRELADWDASASRESDVFWGSDAEVWSQEVRLASSGQQRLGWVAGAYYSWQGLDERFLSDRTDSQAAVVDISYRQRADSISGFGQASYALTPVLTLIAGARYEHERRQLRDFVTLRNGVPNFTDGNRDTGLDEASGKLGLEVRPARGLMLYASASRGVKSGGFTVYNSRVPDQIDPFRPEILYAYEVGFKSDPARAVRLNGSVFFYDYRDQQVLSVVINPQSGSIGRIVNAPRSEIYGGELELQLAPTARLHVSHAISYKYGRYNEFDDVDAASVVRGPDGLYTGRTIDKAGLPVPIAHWGYQGAVSYALPLGARYSLETQADWSWRDELPSFLGPVYDLPDRWIANATLTLRPDEGRWWIGAYARNLFGEKYDLTRNFFLPNASIASPGRPASFGVRLGFGL